jgi:hypothetical protein
MYRHGTNGGYLVWIQPDRPQPILYVRRKFAHGPKGRVRDMPREKETGELGCGHATARGRTPLGAFSRNVPVCIAGQCRPVAQHVSDPDSIGNAVQIDLWCCRHCGNALSAVTNARFAPLHGLLVGPVSHSTTPVPLHKPRARHERAIAKCRSRGLLPSAARRRVVALRLRFARRSSPASAPLCPLANHRPKQSSLTCLPYSSHQFSNW